MSKDIQSQQNDNQQQQKENQDQQVFILAGLQQYELELEQYINVSLFKSDLFNKIGVQPIKGILIYGPSGVGKSSLMKKFQKRQNNHQIKYLTIESKEILSRLIGEGEKKIEQLFQNARQYKPAVLIFEDLHIICGKKDSGSNTSNNLSLINTLNTEMDKLTIADQILCIATTSDSKKIDESIKRTGRFDKEIRIDVPKATDRYQILQAYLHNLNHDLSEGQINEINQSMNGFTGADIVGLIREALLQAIKIEPDQQEQNQNITIHKSDFEFALQQIQPSGIKEILMEIPKVFWDDIGGYKAVKDEIKQVIEWPLKHPNAFKRMGIQPSKGILLYGPPGCSKTMIAKAIATESKLNFLAVKGPELFSKYVGDSEKAIRELFKRARLCSPAVIFFDEIDAIATQRSINTDVSERVLCQLLTEMDGIEGLKNVVIIAATNRPDILDKALTRPGRFDHLIYVPPPDQSCREEIFKINIFGNKMPAEENIDVKKLAQSTEGYSGAEICLICREAGLNALTRDIDAAIVLNEDFSTSIKKVKPRITHKMIDDYIRFADNLKFF